MTITKQRLQDFPFTLEYRTRWADNDAYGHMNNAKYLELFDSITNVVLEPLLKTSSQIALIVHADADYYASVAYPEVLQVGLGVSKLGRSAVHWELGVFSATGTLACMGRYVHVFCNKSQKSEAMSSLSAQRLQELVLTTPSL